jgi:glycine cleavage system T protein (aminomethyltransferase)
MALANFQAIDHFGDPGGEARACRSACALFDFSFLECAQARGHAACRILECFTARSLADLPVGRIRYALRLSALGKLLADLTIWRTAKDTFEIMSGRHEDIAELVDHAGSGMTVTEKPGRAIFALQGPASLEVLSRLGAIESIAALPYFAFADVILNSVACRIGRLGYTGEPGFEIICPRSAADRLWQAIAIYARPAGFLALDMLRIEAGFVLFTNEFRLPVTPAEAGLGKFYQGAPLPAAGAVLISFTANAHRLPLPWQPSALQLPSPGEIAVTSACDSIVAGGVLGLGYVRAGHPPDAPLRDPTGTFDNICKVPLPYYDTAKRRPKQPWANASRQLFN